MNPIGHLFICVEIQTGLLEFGDSFGYIAIDTVRGKRIRLRRLGPLDEPAIGTRNSVSAGLAVVDNVNLLLPVLPSGLDQLASVLVVVVVRRGKNFRDDVGGTVQCRDVDGGSLDTVNLDGSLDSACNNNVRSSDGNRN